MTTTKVCIYTSICGGYDDLKQQPEQTVSCDFVCFTDDPMRLSSSSWQVVPLQAPTGASARLAAKFPKVLPHQAFAVRSRSAAESEPFGYDVTIWIDGSIQILRSTFAEAMLDAVQATGIALVHHPERDCIFDEADASFGGATAHKYRGSPLREQVDSYARQGYPKHNGLLAGGVVVRDMRSPVAREVCDQWWAEIERWSLQDQLSLPYVLWKLGAPFTAIDLDLWHNPLFEVRPHFDAANGDLLRRTRPDYEARWFRARTGGDTLGSYDATSGIWTFPAAEGATRAFSFGPQASRLVPLMGDWDGDSLDSPGLYDPASGAFFLRNRCEGGPADTVFHFGPPGAVPIAGDWTGDGRDSVGIYMPDTGFWALRNRCESGPADIEFSFGEGGRGMVPVAGDWDASGRDRVGLYDPMHAGWFLLDELRDGAPVRMLSFGPDRAVPIVGDWAADGVDKVGVFVREQSIALLAVANHNGSRYTRALVDPIGSVPLPMAWRFDREARESSLDEGELRNDAPDGTPERILPDDLPAAPDHVARYAFAAHWAAGSRVLDLCCGTGYGSNLLAAAGARHVVGVDIAEDVVKYASSKYGSADVEFLCEDATNELNLSNFDLIVCFEGLEHVNRPGSLVRNAARMLAPGGTVLVSSPNSAYYPGGHSGNPYHVLEFSRTEFDDLLRESFDSVEMYCQRESAGVSSRDRALVMRPMCADKSEDGTELGERPFVWLAICRQAMSPS